MPIPNGRRRHVISCQHSTAAAASKMADVG